MGFFLRRGFLFFLVFATSGAGTSVRAEGSACPTILSYKPDDIAAGYCENFRAYNRTPKVREAEEACKMFYRRLVFIAQDVCSYVGEGKGLQENVPEVLARLDKERGQTLIDQSAQNQMIRGRFLSRKYWLRFLSHQQRLDSAYRDYLEVKLKELTRFGGEVLQQEILDHECPPADLPVSFNLIGLAGVSTEEGRKAYDVARPILGKLSHDLMVNSNRQQNVITNLDRIIRNAESTVAVPSRPAEAGAGTPEAPHGHGPAFKVAEGVGIGALAGQTEKGLHGVLHLHKGALIPNPVALGVGTAATLVDVGLRWIEHHKFDGTSLFFIGARVVVTGLGTAGALPSGGATVLTSVVIEAMLNWMESLIRGVKANEIKAKLPRYLQWAQQPGRITSATQSRDLSRRWRNEFWRDPRQTIHPVSHELIKELDPSFPHTRCN